MTGVLEARSWGLRDQEREEKELLEALARYAEITPARAALETTVSVCELATGGHKEVRASEGRLEYALWELEV